MVGCDGGIGTPANRSIDFKEFAAGLSMRPSRHEPIGGRTCVSLRARGRLGAADSEASGFGKGVAPQQQRGGLAMAEKVKLSEALERTASALAMFDGDALEELTLQLNAATEGLIEVEREPIEAIKARQRILAEVLTATEQSLQLLRGLRERSARNQWAL